jgi:hypothetical protein
VVAAAEGKDVSMKHLIYAIAREIHKMGKQVNRVHFGKYYDAVEHLF